ncbi:MAG: UDP-N-acetylmuramoyl-L-alanine--D-glutamate ligase, partial [Bacteroidales bacterium]|nr:UDP-N-acetylmuramoyl-L-alanine--D-glutamate ligase [Bacteroidales bacterium]
GAEVLIESDYERIIPWCYAHTTPGKICLLSPAAASYDAFKNFEERGRVYQQLIEQYA